MHGKLVTSSQLDTVRDHPLSRPSAKASMVASFTRRPCQREEDPPRCRVPGTSESWRSSRRKREAPSSSNNGKPSRPGLSPTRAAAHRHVFQPITETRSRTGLRPAGFLGEAGYVEVAVVLIQGRGRAMRHDQHIDGAAVTWSARRAIDAPEAELLVDDGEREVLEDDDRLNRAFVPDQDVDFARARRIADLRRACPYRGPLEVRSAIGLLGQGLDCFRMLARHTPRRRHQRGLPRPRREMP